MESETERKREWERQRQRGAGRETQNELSSDRKAGSRCKWSGNRPCQRERQRNREEVGEE